MQDILTQLEATTRAHPVVTTLATLAALSIPYFTYKRYSYRNAISVPMLKGLPWFGTVLDMSTFFYSMEKYHKQHGKTFQLFLIGNHYVVTSDFKLLKHIYDHRSNFPMPDTIRDVIAYASGYAMFTSEGEDWSKKHHALAPLFNYKMLQHNFEIVVDMSNKLFSVIEKDISNDRLITLTPYFSRLTMDVIGDVAFGIDIEAIEHPEKEWADKSGKIRMRRSETMNNALGALNVRGLFPLKWLWNLPLPAFNREQRAMKVLQQVFGDIINKTAENSDECINLVSLLIKTNSNPDPKNFPYTFQDMLAECFSLFAAGHDTTARSMAFVTGEIARRPDIQAKIRQEIKRIAEESGETDWKHYRPSFDDYNKMKYIDNVVKESQRLWPILPAIARMAVESETIEGVNIPKGDNIFLDVFSYHRDAEYFPDPWTFDPERWDDEKRHSTLLSFGMGTRACFGRRLATTEIKLYLFNLMQRYNVVSVSTEPVQAEFFFGLKPKGDVRVYLKVLEEE